MFEVVDSLRRFLDLGGPVLLLIAATSALLLAMIIERYWFFHSVLPGKQDEIVLWWRARSERKSWNAHRIREARISDVRLQLSRSLPLIAMLVALCPLLGLLGTVTGMMSVFDVISILGTGNVRAMASGISRATVPTMAGMMVALPGIYYTAALKKRINQHVEQLADQLVPG